MTKIAESKQTKLALLNLYLMAYVATEGMEKIEAYSLLHSLDLHNGMCELLCKECIISDFTKSPKWIKKHITRGGLYLFPVARHYYDQRGADVRKAISDRIEFLKQIVYG